MREPITKLERSIVDRFESIVKAEVDKLDPIGLLAGGAPSDHYAPEIRDITLRLPLSDTWLELSEVMYVVFASYFDIEEASPHSQYLEAAKNICDKVVEIVKNDK